MCHAMCDCMYVWNTEIYSGSFVRDNEVRDICIAKFFFKYIRVCVHLFWMKNKKNGREKHKHTQ